MLSDSVYFLDIPGGVVAEWLARSTRVRKDTGSNPAGAGHCVTTVGKLFTPTVPSRAEAPASMTLSNLITRSKPIQLL